MNIITKSDIKKYLALVKAGLKNGTSKELTNYSSSTKHDGTDVVKEYFVSLEFRFMIKPEDIEQIISEDLMDNEIEELLKP
tara:strand:+ start:452 stop:694 length:243 start_codon:yes stop_codon:yes gene_type:complete